MSIKIKAVKSDADMLSTECVLRDPTSAQKHNLHTEFTYHSKNLSRTLVLQASSELHTMTLQTNLSGGFRKTMPNRNKRCSMQHLNSLEQEIHRSCSKPTLWLQERSKKSKQWRILLWYKTCRMPEYTKMQPALYYWQLLCTIFCLVCIQPPPISKILLVIQVSSH